MKQQPKTAVVVNDDLVQLNILSGLLQKGGFAVSAFAGAEEALTAMAQFGPPDLIVTDLYMPGIDGWRFCRLLRSAEYAAFNRVPILVVSATFAGDEASRITADLGANGFLSSPVDGQRFLDMIRALLAGDRPQEQLQVLIVEDSRTLANVLKKAFEARGYLADIALNRREAREKIHCFAAGSHASCSSEAHHSDLEVHTRPSSYDLVVIDFHLPDGKGDSLLPGIQEAHPECTCIMMTSDPDPDLALTWMKGGAAAYLRKPFKPEYLLELCVRTRREHSLLRVEDLLEKRTRELREHGQQMRSILENLNDVVYATDRAGNVTFVSPNVEFIAGYRPEEIIGRSFIDFVHPEDVKARMPFFLKALAGESVATEYRFVAKDGSIFWVMTRARARLEAGQVAGVQGVLVDIRDRKKAEEELRKSEERYRAVVESQSELVCKWLPDTTLIFVNDAYCRYFGRPREELIGSKYLSLVPEEAKAKVQVVVRELSEDPRPQTTIHEVLSRNGEPRWQEWTDKPIFDEQGSLLEFLSVGRDVTERVQAEQTVAFHSQILSAVQDTVLVVSPEMKTVWSNQAARDLFGDRPEMFSEPCYRFYKGRDTVCEDCPVVKTLADGRTHRAIMQSYDKNGNIVWRLNRAYPYYDEKGRITAAIEIVSDYTAEKQLEDERLALERRIQQIEKAESLSRMAGAVAHHFNNKLAVTLGNLELALESLPQDADVVENLARAEQSARRAAEMSRLMLTYLGQSQGKPRPLELAHICRESLAKLKAEMPEGITLHIHLPKSNPVIEADPEQFGQVLACLVTNAWESLTGDPGQVTVSVGTVHEDRIEGKQFPMDWESHGRAQACLRVTDTGPGMELKTIERIFDPFFTDKFTGRGLGLPVALGIVSAHGGCIVVDSEPGKGSSFRVYWPLSGDTITQPEREQSSKVQGSAGGSVLLVEDQDMVRQMAKIMLERLGYGVLTAKDGAEAVSVFRKQQDSIGVVLTDLSMPRMNGWETLAALRQIRPDIPVILASGYDEAQVLTGDYVEQPQVFLAKPFQMKTLKQALEKAIGQGS